jgi:hypothetical protein
MARENISKVQQYVDDYASNCQDFMVPIDMVNFLAAERAIEVGEGGKKVGFSNTGVSQILSTLKVPTSFFFTLQQETRQSVFNEMKEAYLKDAGNTEHLMRLHDNNVRGFLSDSYARFDDTKLIKVIRGCMGKQADDLEAYSYEKADGFSYFKFCFPGDHDLNEGLEGEKPDIVRKGFCASNSEVGKGSIKIEPLIFRMVCSNGMIRRFAHQQYLMRHYGNPKLLAQKVGAIFYRMDETLDEMIASLRESRKASFDEKALKKIINEICSEAGQTKAKDAVWKAFAKEEDYTKFGLANAFTRAAHETFDGEKQYELEQLGNDILDYDIDAILKNIEKKEAKRAAEKEKSQQVRIDATEMVTVENGETLY